MLPELFKIPGLDIPVSTYALLLTIGFISALLLAGRLAVVDGIAKSRICELAICLLLSGLVGSRLLMMLINWRTVFAGSHRMFGFDSVHAVGFYLGGFLTAVAASVILMRVWHLPWHATADAFAPGLALSNVLGRIGCFAAGCCWGKPTESWIGVRFTEKAHEMNGVPVNIALLPTQLIEACANVAIFALLIYLWKRRSFRGQIIYAYMMLYSIERFVVEFWRDDPRGQIMSLSTSQFISLFMFSVAFISYCWLRGSAPIPHSQHLDLPNRKSDQFEHSIK
ncbi:MAG TPA: prolipoprotein diacylglyceryl transferase [Blastocatellia bacterium]|nr:prolipoprotein diacylglyceryl transferase [Blastocatellia bacterium]